MLPIDHNGDQNGRVGHGGPVVIILAKRIRGSPVQTRPGSMDFSEHNNLEYDILRKGSKAVGPMS